MKTLFALILLLGLIQLSIQTLKIQDVKVKQKTVDFKSGPQNIEILYLVQSSVPLYSLSYDLYGPSGDVVLGNYQDLSPSDYTVVGDAYTVKNTQNIIQFYGNGEYIIKNIVFFNTNFDRETYYKGAKQGFATFKGLHSQTPDRPVINSAQFSESVVEAPSKYHLSLTVESESPLKFFDYTIESPEGKKIGGGRQNLLHEAKKTGDNLYQFTSPDQEVSKCLPSGTYVWKNIQVTCFGDVQSKVYKDLSIKIESSNCDEAQLE